MKLVVFGLTMSSSWGNGHATLWRGLIHELLANGHEVHFFERDVPYYARYRDYTEMPPGGRLHLYESWESAIAQAAEQLSDADVSMVTSYCPDAVAASELASDSPVRLRTFYDLDPGVTLKRFSSGEPVEYLGPSLFRDYDLVLSYNGGKALDELRDVLGAREVVPLYGSVDPHVHAPARSNPRFESDLSYLGTYAEDRQKALTDFFLEPARQLPDRRFCLGGALYPAEFPWTSNIFFVRHLPAAEHPEFYCSSRWTLNITRASMAYTGYCPSGRLFEAAACGTPVISDYFEGLEFFFEPGKEIVVVRTTEGAIAAIEMSDAERGRVAAAARERTLAEHTAAVRARELETILTAHSGAPRSSRSISPVEVS
jgi:spore maturation protein CgeB